VTSVKELGLTDWLLEHGGPVIRYRTATELLDDPCSVDVDRLRSDLLACPLVQRWLGCLLPGVLHHSKATAFENAMGKLVDLGLRAGMRPLDERAEPFRKWFSGEKPASGDVFSPFYRSIVGSGLVRAGYRDEAMGVFWRHRLAVLAETAATNTYRIYVDQDAYGGYPKAFRHHRLVNPEFYPDGEFRLPWIHDLYALAHWPEDWRDEGAQGQIDSVVRFVLHPEYQALPEGYGTMRAGKRRYYAIGWSAHFPGYDGFELPDYTSRYLVQRLERMAHFREALGHRWFRQCQQHLEGFRTETGTYLFPRSYLRELRQGYWVHGAYMGLEENRRPRQALELESTFRMLKIKKLAGLGSTLP
jgi:hypothetical protein